MYDLLKVTMLGLFFGTFGTTLGGIIGVRFQNPSNKILSFILSLAGGLMTSILSFDLIPEALKIASITNVILGIALGIFCMIVCNYLVDKKFTENSQMLRSIKEENKKDLLRAGIVTSIGLAIHNFPEGLAIGSGFGASLTLGYSLAIAICIHDIPEGISMAVPMKNGGMKTSKVLYYVIHFWSNNRDRSTNWKNNWWNIARCNRCVPKLCGWSNAVYSFRRINT